jgi:thymidylate kinase
MSKKIIAISGTQGTGKSYLAYKLCTYLRKQGNNVVVLDELARECPFPINQDATDETQIWLATTQVATELQKLNKYDYVVVDRSVLDSFCYGLYLGETNKDWIFSYLKDYLVNHIKKYYLKLYLLDPVAFNYNIDDKIRDTNEKFRTGIHNKLLGLYSEMDLDYTVVMDDFEVFSDMTLLKKLP